MKMINFKRKQPKNKVAYAISSALIILIIILVFYLIYRGIMGMKDQEEDSELKSSAALQAQQIILELQANQSTEKQIGPIKKDDVVQTHITSIYGDNVDKKSNDVRLIITDNSDVPTDLQKKLIGKSIGDTITYTQKVTGPNYESITSTIKINGIYKLMPMNNQMVADYVKIATPNISDKDLLAKLKKVKTPQQLVVFLEEYIYQSLKNQDQALT